MIKEKDKSKYKFKMFFEKKWEIHFYLGCKRFKKTISPVKNNERILDKCGKNTKFSLVIEDL